jgi:hypothetical protein
MSDPLVTYLEDHMAGPGYASEERTFFAADMCDELCL